MKILAIIPARTGSRGIPGKNITPVAGKPLIAWTIEAAKKCAYIDRIVVSSDGDQILSIAEKHGAEGLKRPASLAGDEVRSEPVIVHAVEALSEKGYRPDIIIYLQPTSPLRTAEHLNEALELFNNKKAGALISVTKADSRMLKAFIEKPNGFITGISNNDFPFMNRQSLPSVYVPNGAIYILKANNFLKNPKFWATKTLPFIMSAEESVDLDKPEDLAVIEKIISERFCQ
jgi:N-acylneuraminate cytidylyltransferase